MKYLLTYIAPLILLLISCSISKDYIITEKDIIPEGTAFNSKTNTIYVGSIYRQKIIGISPNGNITDVISKSVFENFSPIGIEMDNSRSILWVNVALAPIVNQTHRDDWQTTIMAFDIRSKKLIKKYGLIKEEKAFLNDITVSNNGDVYSTESVGSNLYEIDNKEDKLELFLDLKNYTFPNGIVYHQPQNCLFVATNEGIVKVDIATKSTILLKSKKGIDASVIDGLSIHDNYFIGHQSSKVSKFYFNELMTEIIDEKLLDAGKEFDASTTGEVGNGHYHFIVNSQITSGVNQNDKIIKPLDSLENVIIRKIKLK